MKIWIHILIQALSWVLIVAAQLTNILPPSASKYLVLVVSAIQGFLAWYNHQYNPDGTPATVAYEPKKP